MNLWLILGSLCLAASPFSKMEAGKPQNTIQPSLSGSFTKAPVPHWVVDLPGGTLNAATHTERARPVVLDQSIFIGSAAGDALYELSRADGTLVRSFSANSSVESEALIGDKHIYFADTAGTTWCYTRTGDLVWSHQASAPIIVEPVMQDERLFITTVEDQAFAINVRTGKLIWSYQQPKDLMREAELKLYGAPSAVVEDKLVLFGFSDGAIVALDAKDGTHSWTKRIGEGRYPDIVATPILTEQDLYVSAYYQPLLAMDRASQNVRWRLEYGAASKALIHNQDDTELLYHPGRDGKLRAIATSTGAETWLWDSDTNGALSAPQITPAGLLVTSSEGSVYLLDPATGIESWRYHEPLLLSGITASPAIEGRQLVFVTNAGKLYSMISPRDTN
jgi:outer membrane protein assembly factor BamB